MTYMLIRFMAHSLEKMFSSRFKPFTKSTGPLKSFINKGRDIQVLKWSWRHVKRSFPLGKKQNKRKLHKTKVWKLDSRFYRAHRHSISYLHFPHFALDMEEPVGVHKLMTPAEETKKKNRTSQMYLNHGKGRKRSHQSQWSSFWHKQFHIYITSISICYKMIIWSLG